MEKLLLLVTERTVTICLCAVRQISNTTGNTPKGITRQFKKDYSAEKRKIMPFINSKVSVAMSKEKKDSVKAKLGEVISLIPGKSEGWLMVGFEDSYDLYFKGNQDGPTAFVEVKVYGSASSDVFSRLTGAICDIYQEELGIPKDRIYVKYEEVENWGWNGSNF